MSFVNAHRAFVATLDSDAVWLDYFTIKSVADETGARAA